MHCVYRKCDQETVKIKNEKPDKANFILLMSQRKRKWEKERGR